MSSTPIPSAWVEKLFSRFAIRYGATWLRQWEGVDIEAVKADWCNELFGTTGDQIAFALGYLPVDKPPTVGQFRAQCFRMPVRNVPQLPAPSENPEIGLKALAGMKANHAARHPKQWARDLESVEKRGGRLSAAQRAMYRAALETHDTAGVNGTHSAVDPVTLPPRLRAELESA